MKQCMNCQTECNDDVLICPNCGKEFSKDNIGNNDAETDGKLPVSKDTTSLWTGIKNTRKY